MAKADPKSKAVFRKTLAKAMHTDNRALMPKVADRKSNGSWAFRHDPPVLTRAEKSTKQKVIDALNRYSLTLPRERRVMLGHYHVGDVAHRVVGVGSVGTRAYLALLFGNGETDPLFLQVKEAIAPAHLPFLPPLLHEFRHHGKRMVMGQRALPASSDPMLGFRRSTDGDTAASMLIQAIVIACTLRTRRSVSGAMACCTKSFYLGSMLQPCVLLSGKLHVLIRTYEPEYEPHRNWESPPRRISDDIRR